MAYITKQSRAVLRCLESRETLSAAELAETLRRQGETVGLATVYRQLERLAAEGLVHRVPTETGALYRRCTHQPAGGCCLLRCEGCGRIAHLDCAQMESLSRHIAAAHDFRLDPQQTVLTGRCRQCAGEEGGYGAP